MLKDSHWIGSINDYGDVCPSFKKKFSADKEIKSAVLSITAIGVYKAFLNGTPIGDFVLAPGWTAYEKRIQYQSYELSAQLFQKENDLTVWVGSGWHRGKISKEYPEINSFPPAIIASLTITYSDGEVRNIVSDESWYSGKSRVLFSDIYDGEIYDATQPETEYEPVKILPNLTDAELIFQEGEKICEQERIFPKEIFTAPNGDTIIDFGQNFAGYIETAVTAEEGDVVDLSFAEVLDSDGNFYNENYRKAKCCYTYTCKKGKNIYKPYFTFYGFRYVRVNKFPSTPDVSNFAGIAIYSDIRRTGFIECANDKINQLVHNVFSSQKSNFIDVPTDCPQRDERQGWTGDAQIFARTACYNYDVNTFFKKWLRDMCLEQHEDGRVPEKIPDVFRKDRSSAAWGDAITIIPWEIYRAYGDTEILKECFPAMKKWVDFIRSDSLDEYLWTCAPEEKKLWGKHYGDWLALDVPWGTYKGLTDDDFVASAFFANSVNILIKTGKIIGEDVSFYEELYPKILSAFNKKFTKFNTQTECVLALYFDLAQNKAETAAQLAEMIKSCGNKLQTGFVGTPYILYALSDNGYADLAYDLLLREEYPSWLYPLTKGATTIWEHWDGIRPDNSMWIWHMNSFNHYAFGSVLDWIYSVSGGITPLSPGYEKIKIAPIPDRRMGALSVRFNTKHGDVISKWYYKDSAVYYEITTPSPAQIHIGGKIYEVEKGSYMFTD